MAETQTTITYTFKDIKTILESHLEEEKSLKLVRTEIQESGDYDKGTYKANLGKLIFEIVNS